MSENKAIFKVMKLTATIILLGSFAVSFINIPLWDYDFWWHIATGRYIVETGSIPDRDPFSYTSALEENKNQFPERGNFILKQYWLSQVIFYLIYDNAGAAGIILFRTLLLITTLSIVLWRLQRWSVNFSISFVFIFALFTLMTRSVGERPVLFTILFTALTFFILEDFKEKKDRRIYFLLPLMLLWSNLHGGFILGVVIIMVFMVGEGIKIIFKKAAYTRHEIILFYAASGLAIGFSFVNPTGWDAFAIAFSPKYKPFVHAVQEYASPIFLYRERIASMNYWYLFLVSISLIVLITRRWKIDLSHLILLSGLLIMSLTAIRFIVYYGLIASMITGRESDILINDPLRKRFSGSAYKKMLNILTAVTLLSVLVYVVSAHKFEKFRFDIAKGWSVPAAAVDFIEQNRLSGNMFNDYGYGGYLAWRLYPRHKTFIDSRGLNIAVMTEFQWITGTVNYANFAGEVDSSITKIPLWERLVNHYNINFMLLSIFDIFYQIPPVIFQLVESDTWVPVYCDSISIIFVRNTERNSDIIKKHTISKEVVYNTIIFRGANYALFNKVNPRSLISMGDIFYKMGRLKDALAAYKYAQKRMPENQLIQDKINQIEAEMMSKSK